MTHNDERHDGIEASAGVTPTLRDIASIAARRWYWFPISLLLCLGAALLYLSYAQPTYQRTATLIVNDTRKGAASEMAAFNDIIGGIGHSSVDNEVHILKSRHLMEEVVARYGLATRYLSRDGLRRVDMYGCVPVVIEFLEPIYEEVEFCYTILGDSTLRLSAFSRGGGEEIIARCGDTVVTPIGLVVALASPRYVDNCEGEISVIRSPESDIVERYREALKCEVADRQTSIIRLTVEDAVAQRAEDIINGIVEAYNADAIANKQAVSHLTERFIDERLRLLSTELSDADSDIATFKERNNITSPEEYATISIEELQRLKEQTLSLEGSLAMAEYILSQLSNEGVTSLIPASTVAMSGAAQPLATQIERYNTTLLTYERLIASSSASSPAVSDLARQIAALRQTIIASLVGHIEGLNLQIASLKGEQRLAMGRMQSAPTKEKELLSKVRGQKVKEELYIYLLAKHEENALMGAVAESNARIIDRAYGSSSPIRPRSTAIVLTALIMGILLPLAILYLREVTNSTVRSRRDIERVLSVPFLGEIPKHNGKGGGIVVRKDSRDGVSEAFRMLRANLAYMSVGRAMQVVMLTSSIPHSGKTFVSSNLAMALATANKRVVLIDCDLRRRSLTKSLGGRNDRRGITSYLSNADMPIKEIVRSSIEPNLDIIYAGVQPPNPTEMLLSQRLDELITELRQHYDYIVIDSVPAMTIADAMILDRIADLTIYVIRQGGLDRRLLPDIEQLYREHKFRNMGIVLNDVTAEGQGYGYGYEYGYYGDRHELSLWQRIKHKFGHKA
ncbi:MAG: polysaccharide biosynthesis tyrosine autokinase [Alistipes sp.]|nr:polysaccharide biosynthesis tyrosine autokinase [Alistipes sp.]